MFQEITLIDFKKPLVARLKSRKHSGPYRWCPSAPGKGRGFYTAMEGKGLSVDRAGSSFDLRLEEANAHIGSSRLRFTNAYFCDDYGDCSMRPIIARLPHSKGFLAGWTMGAGMCGSLDNYIWETAGDAAYAAHDMAEREAAAEQEYQRREREKEIEGDCDAAMEDY